MFSSPTNNLRPLLFGVFLALVFGAPWWAGYVLGIIICARYFAYEVILIGVVLDFVFADTRVPCPLFYTASFVLVAALATWVRTKLL